MAFTPATLSVIVQPIGGEGMRFLSYRTDDVVATVTAADYFTRATSYGVRAHDLIFVSPFSGAVEPYILVVVSIDDEGNATASVDATAIADVTGLQAALDAKQNASANLTAWSALATSAKQDASANLTTLAAVTPGATGLALLDDTTAAAARTTLDLGSVQTTASLVTDADAIVANGFYRASSTASNIPTALSGFIWHSRWDGNIEHQEWQALGSDVSYARRKSGGVWGAWYALRPVDATNLTFLQAGTGATARTIQDRLRDKISVKDFNAKGDGIWRADGAITSADNTFTSALSTFTSADVGKYIEVEGAGAAGVTLVTTIASINSATSVELTASASTTVSGADFTYGTDDTAEIQAAIDFAELMGGATVYFPRGLYVTSGVLTVELASTILEGAGGGQQEEAAGGTTIGPTTVRAVHTSGAAIRVTQSNCGVRGMRVDSGMARAAAAFAVLSPGIRFEAADTGATLDRVMMTFVDDVSVVGHPGDGIIVVGECAGFTGFRSGVAGNAGHGWCFNDGARTSRTNVARPGLLTLYDCRSQRNGGHSIAMSEPGAATAAATVYRCAFHNFECFGDADDAAVRYGNQEVWGFGAEIAFHNSAFGGMDASSNPEAHDGFYLAGTEIRVNNCRYILVSRCGTIGNRAELPTVDFRVDGVHVSNSVAALDPAFAITAGSEDVEVHAKSGSWITNLTGVGTSTDGVYRTQIDGDIVSRRSRHRAGSYKSGVDRSVADDAATSWLFTVDAGATSAAGIAIISGNSANRGKTLVFFRVGASPECSVLPIGTIASGSVVATTGALVGTTGVDGNFTVSAHTDFRLYIENRTASLGVYNITILSLAEATRLAE